MRSGRTAGGRPLLRAKVLPFLGGIIFALSVVLILSAPPTGLQDEPPDIPSTDALPLPARPRPPKRSQPTQLNNDADRVRRGAVKEAFIHAWAGYKRHAWGGDELQPRTRDAKNWGDTAGRFGLTILEAMDTLWVMGLHDDFEECVQWVAHHLHFNVHQGISHFEATIRMLGGLLAAYEISEEQHPVLLAKAKDLGDRLSYAYNTTLGIPLQIINLFTHESRNPEWMGQRAALSEFASVQLEFKTLSYHTNDIRYRAQVERVMDVLEQRAKDLTHPGLWPIWLDTETGHFVEEHLTLGARGDSFYEVLLKQWLLTGKVETRYRTMWHYSAAAIERLLLRRSTPSHLLYIAEMKDSEVFDTMDHLVCFSGGMFALAAAEWPAHRERWMSIARGLGETCHEMYARTATGLGPEIVDFVAGQDCRPHSWKYILRPEAVETWFYLWRYTKEERWRDYGWQMLQALNRHCRVKAGGFAGIKNVSQLPARRDNLMQSFFLAETLKYLYLLFDDSAHLPLDIWVFTTEAHPLRRRAAHLRKNERTPWF